MNPELAEQQNCQRLRELYEERSAIMEYDGILSRDDAESNAWLDVFGEPCESIEQKAIFLLGTK